MIPRPHSPTPWRVVDDRNGSLKIVDAEGVDVIEFGDPDGDDYVRGDIDLIVAGVNALAAAHSPAIREAHFPPMIESAPSTPAAEEKGAA